VYSTTGSELTTFGTKGVGNGEFQLSYGVAFSPAPSMHMYVADMYNMRVQVFGNALPVSIGVSIGPGSPHTTDDLVLSSTPTDADGDSIGTMEVRWYKNNVLQPAFNNTFTIPAAWTNRSETWNASIRLHDGWEFGPQVWCPSVIIGNTAPAASAVRITTASPVEGASLDMTYLFTDVDGDSRQAPQVHWYVDGVRQATYDNLTALPSSVTNEGEHWSVGILPYDGSDYGTEQVSTAVTIAAEPAPSIDPFLIIAACGIIGVVFVVIIVASLKSKKKRGNSAKKIKPEA
jgi:hypothetical protein